MIPMIFVPGFSGQHRTKFSGYRKANLITCVSPYSIGSLRVLTIRRLICSNLVIMSQNVGFKEGSHFIIHP